MRKFVTLITLIAALFVMAMPAFAQERPSIPELLANDADGRFTTLLAAVEAAGLTDALSGEGPFTVLAPTNDAFAAALDYLGIEAEDLLGDTETLTQVLTYHVLPGQYFLRNVIGGAEVATLQGENVTFGEDARGRLAVNGTAISDVDNVASNGVVFALDGVILPSAIAEAAAANRANVRFAHFSPDAGAVDIYLDGELVAENVTFGTVSEWTGVAGGGYRLAIAPTGSEPNSTMLGRIEGGSHTTVFVSGYASADRLSIRWVQEDYSPLAEGAARVAVFHGIETAPVIDVLADGNLLIRGLAYPRSLGNNDGYDTRDLAAGTYTVSVVVTGTTSPALLESTLTLNAGSYYLVAAIGTPTNPQIALVETAAAAE